MPTPTLTDTGAGDARIKRGPQASAGREYVASAAPYWMANYLRTLPPYVDDLTHDLGDDLYERMLFDPQVKRCLNLLVFGILAGGLKLVPAREEGDPDYARAEELAQFAQRNLDRLDDPLMSVTLPDLLDAMMFGHRVAEQNFEVVSAPDPDAGKLCLTSIKVKPRRATAFVVDTFNNILGLIPLGPGQYAPLTVGGEAKDLTSYENVLPRRKFAILIHRKRAGDPRGQSIGRCIYNAWWHKLMAWPQYLANLTQFGTPGLHGTTAEGAENVQLVDATGALVYNADGSPTLVSPELLMMQALQAYRGGGIAVTAFGTTVGLLEAQGDGGAFTAAIGLYNQEIEGGLLCQTLATSEGKHQARAASEVHQDTLGVVLHFLRRWVEGFLYTDIFRPLIRDNYGPEAAALTPLPSLGEVDQQDLAAMWTALASLETSGFTDPSQKRKLDAQVGLPERDPESIQREIDAHVASLGADGYQKGLMTRNEARKLADLPPVKEEPEPADPQAGGPPGAGDG